MLTVECFGKLPHGLTRDTVAKLARAAYRMGGGKKSASVAVRVVDADRIRRLNYQYRHKDKPTDVLSFAYGGDHFPAAERSQASQLGDVVICDSEVSKQAKSAGRAAKDEFSLMVVHGMLHLMGFDHETEAQEKKMFKLQHEILLREGVI